MAFWLCCSMVFRSAGIRGGTSYRRSAACREAFSDAELAVMAAAMAQPDAMRSKLHWYRASFRYKPARRTGPIEAPTLLLWAKNDVALGKRLTYGLERWVPDLELHYIPHCGHRAQNETAQQVNEWIFASLQRSR